MSDANDSMSIGEAARRADVRPSALRYYESVGLLPAPRRVGGQRRYDVQTVSTVRFIRIAQATGFSLDEVKTLLGAGDAGAESPYAERLRRLAAGKLREVDALITRATMMKTILEAGLACTCIRPEDCLLFVATDAPGEEPVDRTSSCSP